MENTQKKYSIHDLRKLLIAADLKADTSTSMMTLIRAWGLVFITQYLLWIIPDAPVWYLVKVPLFFVSGLSFVGLFVIGHDCGHNSFSKYRWLNFITGTVCHFTIMNGFLAWKFAHDFHHQNTQIRKIDPDWPELLYLEEENPRLQDKLSVDYGVGTPIGILAGFWVGMLKRALPTFLIPQMKLSFLNGIKLYGHVLFSFIATVVLLYSYYEFLGPVKFIEMYALPCLVGTTIGALLTFLHHTHENSYVFDQNSYDPMLAQVMSTWNVRFPRWMEWMWLDINIHLPHHIATWIPWYHLREATEIIRQFSPELVQEKKWSWSLMMSCWRSTKLSNVSVGVYQLKSNR
jgi:acyl-lipid omega-6 desaturase (Delta-12 desaturase)